MMKLQFQTTRKLLSTRTYTTTHSRCLSTRIVASQSSKQYFVTCHPGLEDVVAKELRSKSIDAQDVQTGKAGVFFRGDTSTCYRSNLHLRAAIRVLELMFQAPLDPRRMSGDTVYEAFREAGDWAQMLKPDQCFSIESRVWGCSTITSSQLLNIRARDAICDAIRDKRGEKPLPPLPGKTADLPLFATAFQDNLTIYRDTSGTSLHRRGYRAKMTRASLNESAAAGCLYLAGWDRACQKPGAALADPMCGSGTFLIEAALMATNTAPGLFRRWWPFFSWKDEFDKQVWDDAVDAAESAQWAPATGLNIWGNDVHRGALSLAARDAEAAQVRSLIKFHHGECKSWTLPQPPQLVVSNPPWGQRLLAGRDQDDGSDADEEDPLYGGSEGSRGGRDGNMRDNREESANAELADAWFDLSVFLKQQAKGADAYLLSGNSKATKHLRLRADTKFPITVGGIDCRLLKYSIH